MREIGNIHRLSMLELARRLVSRIMQSRQPVAVVLSDSGDIDIVGVDAARDSELVGVYRYAGAHELQHEIAVDLTAAMLERGLQKQVAA